MKRSPDPTDDFLLALSEGGEADYLVTDDKSGLLALNQQDHADRFRQRFRQIVRVNSPSASSADFCLSKSAAIPGPIDCPSYRDVYGPIRESGFFQTSQGTALKWRTRDQPLACRGPEIVTKL